jgi:hypothetical protein
MRTFNKMGMSSEKLDGRTLEHSEPHKLIGLSSPASRKKVQDRLLQIVIYQTT